MKKTVLLFQSIFFISLLTGCEYFSTSTHTPQQIKKASTWSEEDQGPSFSSCQDLSSDEQFSCFKDTITQSVNDALYAQELISTAALNEEVVLVILIDSEGNITLDSVEDDAEALNAIPGLYDVLSDAILSLPQAVPSTKTNVGVSVAASIELPIQVVASPR